jgi:taspase (threonine aspartase 1)
VTPTTGHSSISSSSSYDDTSGTTPTSTSSSSSGPSALDTVTALIAALEDDPEFNAGYGSNLTFDGDVECDAALMDGGGGGSDSDSDSDASCESWWFGSVGAVRGVRNPVVLARRVLDERRRRLLSLSLSSGTGTGMGRVPPLMLVGEGAARFAGEVGGVRVVRDPLEMVAPRARREWCVWKGRWEEEEERQRQRHDQAADSDAAAVVVAVGAGMNSPQAAGTDSRAQAIFSGRLDDDVGVGAGGSDPLRARQDTVGAVVLVGDSDTAGRDAQVSAGVSRCADFKAFHTPFFV